MGFVRDESWKKENSRFRLKVNYACRISWRVVTFFPLLPLKNSISFDNVAFAVNSCSSVRSSVWWEQGGGTVAGVVRREDSVN